MKLSMHPSILLFALGHYPSLSEGSSSGLRRLQAKASIECDVQLAVGQIEEEGSPEEILHCGFDEPDDLGYLLYEIKGLEDDEFLRIKNTVMTSGSTRYEFPGATRTKGKPAHAASLFGGKSPAISQAIHVPKSTNGKPQAIEKGKGQDKDKIGKGHRDLYNLQGVSTVLAVRIIALDAQTTSSVNDCRVHTFGGYDDSGLLDDMNMKSQIDACSYGKLKFVEPEDNPTYPDVVGGVVTITLNQTVAGVSHATVLSWARETTPLYAGPLNTYDHVMYFMPPGVAFNGAAAFGYVPGRETWYMDSYSLKTGVQLHELGHNLGLSHSGEDDGGYGDSSCYMGYGGGDIRLCYNAPKSWYLGWYSEFHNEWDPVKETSKLFHLVGLADYNDALASSNPLAYTIVLRIETYEKESLYLTYNRQKGVNVDVKAFQDKVTIVRADGGKQSWVEAGLAPGERYSRSIVDSSGLSVEIVVCEHVTGSPDYALVSVHPFGETPLCAPQSPIPSWNPHVGSLYDNLVAHYTFDNHFLDSSGNRYHSFDFGNIGFTTDGAVSGKALSFDGIDDYVELPNIEDLNFGLSDFTVTFWYRVSGDQVGRPAIITNKDWRSTSNPGWIVSSNYGSGSNGDDLAINLSDGTTTIDGSKAIDVGLNTWHFVAIRVNRGQKMSLLRSDRGSYVLQEDSIAALAGSLSTNMKIRLGSSHEGCGAGFTKMDLDDLGIWSRALSSEEVMMIWMSGRKNGFNILQAYDSPNTNDSPRPSAMVAKYDLENGPLDSTANDLAGVLTDGGGLSFEPSADGYYMNLNNVDFSQKSYVILPSSSLLDFGADTPFTLALWVRSSNDFSSGGTSIISNKDWSSGSNPGWTLGVGSNGRYEFNVGDGSQRCDYDGPSGQVNDGTWHHLAFSVTRGAEGKVTLYVDGKVVDQKTCVVDSVSSMYPTVIGTDGRLGAKWPRFFTGDVDKVTIFASSLEHSQLFELYSQGRSDAITFGPSASPTTAAPTSNPTMRPTASPVTASPTSGPSGPFYIRNPSSGKILTIDGGLCDDGTNIVPGSNGENDWQKWMLNFDNTIESVQCPGMVVGLEGTVCGNSVSVVLKTKSSCDGGQAWTLREDKVMVNSKCDTKALDIAAGSNIILWSVHGGSNQLWELTSAMAPPTLSPTSSNPTVPVTSPPSFSPTSLAPSTNPTDSPTALPSTSSPTASPKGPFVIKNPATGKLLTIDGGLCSENTNMVLWQDDDENSQKWMLNHDNSIESLHCPGMVVGFEGVVCGDSVSVVLRTKVDAKGFDDQAWNSNHDSTGIITNVKCNTKAIDISGGGSNNGANLILYSIHSNWNQLWEIVPTGTATSNPTAKPSLAKSSMQPTAAPSSTSPTKSPGESPVTLAPTTSSPTVAPSSAQPTTATPTKSPSAHPVTNAPSSNPGTITLSPTQTVVALNYVGNNGSPTSAFPLGQCEGDCDNDGECGDGLRCFQRTGAQVVPGCGGLGTSGTDYCASRGDPNSLWLAGNNGSPSLAFPLGLCEGDCDSDAECAPGLKCMQRKGDEAVPGCSGPGNPGEDYCIDPKSIL